MDTDKYPEFELEQFTEVDEGVFIYKESAVTLDTKIYKYMDLKALFGISKKKFRVSRRKDYEDYFEHGKVTPRCVEGWRTVNTPVALNELKEREECRKFRESSAELQCTCFTKNSKELHCMWKSFTSGYTGIRVETTIRDFIKSLTINDYDVFIGSMEYSKYDIGAGNRMRYLFTKDECYYPEEELRIYFVPKNRNINICNHFEINGIAWIHKVILSPFIPDSLLKGWFYKSLTDRFSELKDKISRSSIWMICK